MAIAVLLMVLGFAQAGVSSESLKVPYFTACWYLAGYLSAFPHEIGHALMAKAVGYRPLAILWGDTQHFFETRWFNLRILIGRGPRGGATFFETTDERSPRLKLAAVTSAGVIVNGLLAWAAFVLASTMVTVQVSVYAKWAVLAFGVANIVLAIGNLWPSTIDTPAGRIPNDGLRLVSYLGMKPLRLQENRVNACRMRIYFAYREEAYDQVLAEADAAEAIAGAAMWIDLSRSAALCGLDRPAEARELLRRSLPGEGEIQTRALVHNNLAWASFLLDEPESDAEAMASAARAFDVLPWMGPVLIVRACVLAARAAPGSTRLAEARAMLDRAERLRLEKSLRSAVAIALGLIAASEGHPDVARRQLEIARTLGNPGLAAGVLEARLSSR